MAAISRHAWTFAGSGVFSHQCRWTGQPQATLRIQHNPLCRDLITESPACAYYAATFERLFRVLVHPHAQVRETACEAMGAPACVFEIGW